MEEGEREVKVERYSPGGGLDVMVRKRGRERVVGRWEERERKHQSSRGQPNEDGVSAKDIFGFESALSVSRIERRK